MRWGNGDFHFNHSFQVMSREKMHHKSFSLCSKKLKFKGMIMLFRPYFVVVVVFSIFRL